jgi:phosphotriesterase-related protein
MPTINTVRGPVDTSALGQVLMHEHVFVLSPEFIDNYPEHNGFDEDAHIPEAIRRLNELKAAGIETIVDLTVVGLGRYIPRIKRINAEADINIVVATGLYTYNDVPHYLHFRGPGTMLGGEEPLVDFFVKDITEGIADTGVKAGILKCATDEPA